MPERPPSPPTAPLTPTGPAATVSDERVLATTAQLATTLEETFDIRIDEDTLEALLLELDRRELVVWEGVSATGAYVWECNASADRLADAIAAAVVDRLESWLDDALDLGAE